MAGRQTGGYEASGVAGTFRGNATVRRRKVNLDYAGAPRAAAGAQHRVSAGKCNNGTVGEPPRQLCKPVAGRARLVLQGSPSQ